MEKELRLSGSALKRQFRLTANHANHAKTKAETAHFSHREASPFEWRHGFWQCLVISRLSCLSRFQMPFPGSVGIAAKERSERQESKLRRLPSCVLGTLSLCVLCVLSRPNQLPDLGSIRVIRLSVVSEPGLDCLDYGLPSCSTNSVRIRNTSGSLGAHSRSHCHPQGPWQWRCK